MTPAAPTPATLRAYAAARTLWREQTLQAALDRLGFLQADPIRAPARAQDLQLMQRVRAYRAGDLERRYATLDIEEDSLPNYGFVTPEVHRLLHPRAARPARIEHDAPGLSERVLAHVREHGPTHPRRVAEALGRTRVGNAWGGASSATTRALEALHHAGHLRVTHREQGVKVYGPARTHAQPPLDTQARAEGIVRLIVNLYAPLPRQSLTYLLGLCSYGAPGMAADLRAALTRLQDGWLASASVNGLTYLWPAHESPDRDAPGGARLLTPFDPLVWDRRRFEHLHGWTYRFEAYTPPARRTFGYYALPLLVSGRAVGWANLTLRDGALHSDVQLTPGTRRTALLDRAVNAELGRYRTFLGLPGTPPPEAPPAEAS
ncbi:DNA glycosylase AlkZ-like family protein [Deinococcus aquiradiocola]|uniref:Winged helix-turn-helix domain-containing protein n=1 Tax=Deinococcus aquiradiocola TaxID=393059 RepID=A0A917P7P4_9DEIO|nr:crosslink repair DNA glycosylase YcaQ family protein [Deinococcus aquiradiocola]GGJ65804.1 hypothetical protein GCM10008939_07250 [Deinococcus aquiradiocola]